MRFALAALVPLALATTGYAGTWKKTQDIVGGQFYDHFRFDNIPDPTNGRVDYVDGPTAKADNLTYTSDDTFILRADYKNKVAAGQPGRKSVRLVSTQTFDRHVSIYDVRHMPQGCGTWPSIWEAGLDNYDTYPNDGEIDIIEGVDDVSPNSMTVATTPGCTVPKTRKQTGKTEGTNCDATVDSGCAVWDARENSFGPPFNANGGGWFAMERTDSFIKVWFWPRDVPPPSDVKSGSNSINTDTWGTPSAYFPTTDGCNIGERFNGNNIIINLTFCGDWAGSTYNTDGCPGSCTKNVDNNPDSFTDAYFDIASARIYE